VLIGALAAITSLQLLGLLGLAVEFAQFDPAALESSLPDGFGRGISGCAALSMLLGFMLGGYVAARSAGVRQPQYGVWWG
jgi:hypothetical protein